ncbi:neurotrophin receptor-interacting factor homolog [Trichoplusia ni]|uniref:Neurotrophin receptor-interacting factor homolog n=1 Tax=Trichoplusia ni TaxID=7111 RepID=A0A7E5VA87_TRINI|nr:neurotrophin receptor-interacting factor homolog [Trichoplusia ni]
MNFAPFTGHIPTAAAIPSIHQFAAKFGYEGTGSSSGGVLQETRYQASGSGGAVQFAVAPAGGVPADGVKFRQAESVVVVSSAQPGTVALAGIAPIHTVNTGVKYQTISATSSVNLGNIAYGGQASYVQAETVHQQLKAEQRADKREYREELHHDLMATMMQQHQGINVSQAPLQQGTQQLLVVLHEPKEAAALARAIKQEGRTDRAGATAPAEFISIGDVTDSSTWQTLGGSGVADYLSTLPLPLHHLLKYSTPITNIVEKREEQPTIVTAVNTNGLNVMPNIATMPSNVNSVVVQTATIVNQTVNSNTSTVIMSKKKKKKKSLKEKKPRPKPGEIRLTTALDGSTLYCCPECHMAYPERELLEQHLVGHTMERRFICDICNAALKRKDHLTRHKQSHNPERPHVCSVCLKAFKRKEQLTLHFVIHSGEKRHVCNECGKGFYRKDHLRKHTRSHIARRVKAELSQQGSASPPLAHAVPAPAPS